MRPATGTFLLALLLCGLALQLTPAQAQPTLAAPAPTNAAPFSPEQKSEIELLVSVSNYQDFCKNALDLKLENATIAELTTRIKATFPTKKVEIRERDARPLRVSLDLKETTVGTVLGSVAALADCKLWVLPDGLLIAPPGKLNSVERDLVKQRMAGEWGQSVQAGGNGWSSESLSGQIFAKLIAQEVNGRNLTANAEGDVKIPFANFSPESQVMLQKIATGTWRESRGADPMYQPFVLSPDSLITVNTTDPKRIILDFRGGASDPYAGRIHGMIRYP